MDVCKQPRLRRVGPATRRHLESWLLLAFILSAVPAAARAAPSPDPSPPIVAGATGVRPDTFGDAGSQTERMQPAPTLPRVTPVATQPATRPVSPRPADTPQTAPATDQAALDSPPAKAAPTQDGDAPPAPAKAVPSTGGDASATPAKAVPTQEVTPPATGTGTSILVTTAPERSAGGRDTATAHRLVLPALVTGLGRTVSTPRLPAFVNGLGRTVPTPRLPTPDFAAADVSAPTLGWTAALGRRPSLVIAVARAGDAPRCEWQLPAARVSDRARLEARRHEPGPRRHRARRSRLRRRGRGCNRPSRPCRSPIRSRRERPATTAGTSAMSPSRSRLRARPASTCQTAVTFHSSTDTLPVLGHRRHRDADAFSSSSRSTRTPRRSRARLPTTARTGTAGTTRRSP